MDDFDRNHPDLKKKVEKIQVVACAATVGRRRISHASIQQQNWRHFPREWEGQKAQQRLFSQPHCTPHYFCSLYILRMSRRSFEKKTKTVYISDVSVCV